MSRWLPWRHTRSDTDRAGLEEAKQQLEVARAIEHHAEAIANEHRELMRRNHFAESFKRALEGR